jgi:YD repeat-containing protein
MGAGMPRTPHPIPTGTVHPTVSSKIFRQQGREMIRHRAARILISLLLVLPVVVLATTITYTYDNLGRLKTATQDNGNQTGYTYDAAGNRQAGTSFAPGTVQFASTSYSVNENAGSVSISVSRVGGSSGAASVPYQTSNGTAISGTNYTGTSGTLSWAAGDATTKSVTVTILDDHKYDSNTSFGVTLSGASGASLGSQTQSTVTVANTDPAQPGTISLSPSTYSVVEANTSVTVSVTRTGGSDGAVSAQYATSGGTAAAGTNYTSVSGTLNWASGDTATKTFSVPINQYGTTLPSQTTVGLVLSNAGGSPAPTLGTSSGTLTIIDSHPGAFAFASSTYSLNENAGPVVLSVTRSNGMYGPVSVSFSTADGSAVAGTDYTATSGTLSWSDQDTSTKTITVPIINGTVWKPNVTFTVNLSSPTNGSSLGSPTAATVTIINVNGPGVPTNLHTSPAGTALGGGFTVIWTAATGSVNHYTLLENNENSGANTNYTVAAPTVSKVFSKSGVENVFTYQVRACSTSDESVCSAYSAAVNIGTCPAKGCP